LVDCLLEESLRVVAECSRFGGRGGEGVDSGI
jgi:hypothetical protein